MSHSPLFTSPPTSLCILRLSAVGDVCHALAVVQHIQRHWPQTKLTWIVGKTEMGLLYNFAKQLPKLNEQEVGICVHL